MIYFIAINNLLKMMTVHPKVLPTGPIYQIVQIYGRRNNRFYGKTFQRKTFSYKGKG